MEAGVSFKEIKRALSFRLAPLVGCLVTHRHRDHSESILELLRAGRHVFALEDVFESFPLPSGLKSFQHPLKVGRGVKLGGFKVLPFEVHHDVPCVGFYIQHPEMGRLIFITDFYKLDFSLPPAEHLLLEANYSEEILSRNIDEGKTPLPQRKRLFASHMELEDLLGILREAPLGETREIILLHLSDGNAHEEVFRQRVMRETGLPCYIAGQGLELSLDI